MDNFPWRWFAPRILDMCFYLLAFILFVELIIISAFKPEASGLIILLIGIYSKYRQSSYYSVNHIENSLISGEIIHSPVHQIAKLRSKISKINVLIIVAGTVIAGWGAFG